MGIPISAYIDIKSKIIQGAVGTRDFSGLVFTADSMKATVGSDFTAIKGEYDAGNPVALTSDAIKECFADTTDIYKFASKYFGYNGGNHSPVVLNVAKVLTESNESETALSAYNRVLGKGSNFGAFTFIGNFSLGTADAGGLLDVATANESSSLVMCVVVSGTQESDAVSALAGCTMVHLLVSTVTSGTNLNARMFLAWYASVDYTKVDASATIDYKQFAGADAEVDTASTKQEYDADHANYIGLVQVNGSELKFYQTGVNMNGIDSGVVRDRVWMEGEIQAGWFNLTSSTTKVPANYVGAAMVKAMIVGVATAAVGNGAILLDKTLDESQKAAIRAYTGTDEAIDIIESTGYYVDAKVIKPEGESRYVCQYTLVYAKGDHIGKVSGTNFLV